LREAGSGPVVTAGRVVSGLERMFMASSSLLSFRTVRGTRTDPESRSADSWCEIPGSRYARPGMTLVDILRSVRHPEVRALASLEG
jgi:hypothetical protein